MPGPFDVDHTNDERIFSPFITLASRQMDKVTNRSITLVDVDFCRRPANIF